LIEPDCQNETEETTNREQYRDFGNGGLSGYTLDQKDGKKGDYTGNVKVGIVGEVGKVGKLMHDRKRGDRKPATDFGKAIKHMVNRELKNLNGANHDSFTRKSDRKWQKTEHLAYAV
jgi:hypothetical protein